MCESLLALPVVRGAKSASERFAGAEATYTIEGLMQVRASPRPSAAVSACVFVCVLWLLGILCISVLLVFLEWLMQARRPSPPLPSAIAAQNGWALQCGTSHFLGQNFAKAFDVRYQTADGGRELVWATSWGVTTRLIGALVMSHSDDAGAREKGARRRRREAEGGAEEALGGGPAGLRRGGSRAGQAARAAPAALLRGHTHTHRPHPRPPFLVPPVHCPARPSRLRRPAPHACRLRRPPAPAGLVLPPRIAPYQVVICPFAAKDPADAAAVDAAVDGLKAALKAHGLRVHVDSRDHVRAGAK